MHKVASICRSTEKHDSVKQPVFAFSAVSQYRTAVRGIAVTLVSMQPQRNLSVKPRSAEEKKSRPNRWFFLPSNHAKHTRGYVNNAVLFSTPKAAVLNFVQTAQTSDVANSSETQRVAIATTGQRKKFLVDTKFQSVKYAGSRSWATVAPSFAITVTQCDSAAGRNGVSRRKIFHQTCGRTVHLNLSNTLRIKAANRSSARAAKSAAELSCVRWPTITVVSNRAVAPKNVPQNRMNHSFQASRPAKTAARNSPQTHTQFGAPNAERPKKRILFAVISTVVLVIFRMIPIFNSCPFHGKPRSPKP